MLPNIVLIGFMGCGKSSVGRRLAGLTGHRFVDTDDLVIQAEDRSISEIFADAGEAYFREVEQRVLEETVGVYGIILSTGGGLVLREPNQVALRKIGVIGWLDAEPDMLFERASRSGKRPLLQTENPRASFDQLLDSRRDIYTKVSDFRIDTTHLNHDDAAQHVLDEALRTQRRFEG